MGINWQLLIDFGLVAAFGGLIGAGELVSRYRDAPVSAVNTTPGWIYIALNAAAAAFVLSLIRAFDWKFGLGSGASPEAIRWTQLVTAGFGAMAVFRSSLFTVRVGNQDVSVGPASFLQLALTAADREVDRHRGGARSTAVSKLMGDVSFTKAAVALPALCLALMQNLPQDQQQSLARTINDIRGLQNLSDEVKVSLLGLALLNVVGEDVLRSAVKDFRNQLAVAKSIQIDPDPVPSLSVGLYQLLTVTATDATGATVPLHGITWATDNPATLSVLPDGTLHAVAPGTARVTAKLDGVEKRFHCTVV
ncbi:MAG: Ig-like domain-containing protein [Gemmatimonadaceae bacterium]|nr:Ig-like domain-containing protein [Gemmatimonadaceae bacterium]